RKRTRQSAECELIVFFGVGIRIPNRTPDHDRSFERTDLAFGLNPDIAQHDCDEVLERELLSENARAREQLASHKGFQRLDESSFLIRSQVTLDSDRPTDAWNTRLKI